MTQSATAEECRFQYWEVIPTSTTCAVYHLPDFNFRPMPQSADADEHIRRFCARYQVISWLGTQVVSYCYTGNGERVGPSFRLGDENWNYLSKKKDRVYLADLNFEGCNNGEDARGIVFAVGGWRNAPSHIQRFWPLNRRIPPDSDSQ